MSNGKSEAHGRVRRAVQQAREALQERFKRAQHKQSELMVKAREESALGMLKRSLLGKREKNKTAEAKLEEEKAKLEALKEVAKKYSGLDWRSSSIERVKRRLEFRHAVKKAVPEELRGAFNHASSSTAKDLVEAYEQNKESQAFLEFLKFHSQVKRVKEAGALRVVRAAYFAKEKRAEAKEYLFAKALEFEKRGQWKTFDKIAERARDEQDVFAFACELALEHAPENASQQRVEAVRNVVVELIENDIM